MTTMRRWPLWFVAAPAAVAVWSGWVGLGAMCGFGVVHPLPGIAPGLQLNTAITLPIGVEAYGATALGAWLRPGIPDRASKFARRSALGALVLGMLGQVSYHLLAASGHVTAPWPVVVAVSCMPVVTLGFAASLMHLLRAPGIPAGSPVPAVRVYPESPLPEARVYPEPAPADRHADSHADTDAGIAPGTPYPAPGIPPGPLYPAAGYTPGTPPPAGHSNGHHEPPEGAREAVEMFGDDLARGDVPGVKRLRDGLGIGQAKATAIRDYLTAITPVAATT